jgi:hypothetical protein
MLVGGPRMAPRFGRAACREDRVQVDGTWRGPEGVQRNAWRATDMFRGVEDGVWYRRYLGFCPAVRAGTILI